MYQQMLTTKCRLLLESAVLFIGVMAFGINAQEITTKSGVIEQKSSTTGTTRASEMPSVATRQIDTSEELESSILQKSALAFSPILISPPQGAVLDNGRTDFLDVIVWDFDWSDVAEATQYNLYVIHPQASLPVINIMISASSYHHENVAYIVDANRFGWTWKVRAMVNGVWEPFSEMRTFDVEPVNTDSPSIVVDRVLRVPAEFPTIQRALDAAATGDTVLVAPGVYRERLTITRKIVLLSEAGANRTVVNSTGLGDNKQSWVINVFALCTISGFTLTSNDLYTFGVNCNTFSPIIENNIIENVTYSGVFCQQASPIIRRNLIKGCQQCGIIMNTSATPHIIHNTIVANRTGIAASTYSQPYVVNNIVAQNIYQGLSAEAGAGMTNWCNDIWGSNSNYSGNVRKGEGEISVDPLFVGGHPFDYHLQANSPCINAGDPAAPKDPDKTCADLGAYPYDMRTEVTGRETPSLPTELFLEQNYPNPFNPSTTIEFTLPKASFVKLQIHDLLGHEVATLISEKLPAGNHQRSWMPRGLASGVYVYRLELDDAATGLGRRFVQSRKLVLLQ